MMDIVRLVDVLYGGGAETAVSTNMQRYAIHRGRLV